MEEDRLLSLVDAGKIAQRSPERLRQYIQDGRLKGVLIGKSYVVRESALRQLIDADFKRKKPGRPRTKQPPTP